MKEAVKITLDRERTLWLTVKSFEAATRSLGLQLGDIAQVRERAMTKEGFIPFLWAALVHEDPDLTIEKVGALVDKHYSDPEGIARFADAAAKFTRVIVDFIADKDRLMEEIVALIEEREVN